MSTVSRISGLTASLFILVVICTYRTPAVVQAAHEPTLGEATLAALRAQDARVYEEISIEDWDDERERDLEGTFDEMIESRIAWANLRLPRAIEQVSILPAHGGISVSMKLHNGQSGTRGALMLTVLEENRNILVEDGWLASEEERDSLQGRVRDALVAAGAEADAALEALAGCIRELRRQDSWSVFRDILRYSDRQLENTQSLVDVVRLTVLREVRRGGAEFGGPVPQPDASHVWRLGRDVVYIVPYRRRVSDDGHEAVWIRFWSFDGSDLDVHGTLQLVVTGDRVESKAIELIDRIFVDDFRDLK